jgi:hypothetical protein
LKERKKERLVPIATGAHLQKKNQLKERKIDRLVPIATSAHLQKKNQSKERKTSANCIMCEEDWLKKVTVACMHDDIPEGFHPVEDAWS